MRNPANCDHESVRIRGIIKARRNEHDARTIKGECERCLARVWRVQTPAELRTGTPDNWWRTIGDGVGFGQPA